MDAANREDASYLDERLAPDYVYHGPGGDLDTDGFKAFPNRVLSAFPEPSFGIEDRIAAGDKVVARWTLHGAHRGEFQGIAPTGKEVTIPGIIISRFESGKAAEEWEEADLPGRMRQLGVMAPPANQGRQDPTILDRVNAESRLPCTLARGGGCCDFNFHRKGAAPPTGRFNRQRPGGALRGIRTKGSLGAGGREDRMEARDHERHKKLITRIADDIWNRGQLAVIDEVMSPDGKYHGPHMPNGLGDRETWKRAIGMYRSAFPDSHVTFDELIASGDTVVGRWSATGTHTGELPGVPATGKPISIGGITIYRFRGGKVVEAWEQLDMLGMWQQLGVLALPGHRQ